MGTASDFFLAKRYREGGGEGGVRVSFLLCLSVKERARERESVMEHKGSERPGKESFPSALPLLFLTI